MAGYVSILGRTAGAGNTTRSALLNAFAIGTIVYAACVFGNLTRPADHLSAFWPANALLLGLMLRNPRMATPLSVVAAAVGYMAADLSLGGALDVTLLLTLANLAGVGAGYGVFSRLEADDLHLKRPAAMVYFALGVLCASASAGVAGAIANPILFGGTVVDGWTFWFVSELALYVTLLPVVLTFPDGFLQSIRERMSHFQFSYGKALPIVALVLSGAAALVIGGPGAVAFPVPALLWCALSYSLFTTSVLTLLFSLWTLLIISNGLLHLSFDNNDWQTQMSVRIGVTLMALAPITVGSVIAARDDLLQRLQHLASHDQLTGLLNRSGFKDRAERQLALLAAEKRPVAVLMIDIDRFKSINDSHGHAAGDRVLVAFAKGAAEHLRDEDVFGRVGGEEFAVLLPNCRWEDAEEAAERIRAGFARTPVELEGARSILATVSVGSASCRQAPLDLDSLLLAADKALYRAKKAGRNRIEKTDTGSSAGVASRSTPKAA